MNKELQSRLTKYLDYLESAASSGADAVSAATPVVCQEILLWNAVFCMQFVVISLFLAIWLQRNKALNEKEMAARNYTSSSDDSQRGFFSSCALFGWLLFFGVTAVAASNAARSYLTPHLVIIDAVKSAIHK